MRANRVPQSVKSAQVAKGSSVAYRIGKLLCVKYKDKRDVYMLTNIHQETTQRKRVRGRHETFVDRPDCISDYNAHMGGVDKVDQLLSPYDATRKTLKWYKKLAVHFVQISMLNAYILYKKKPENKMTFLKYQTTVIKHLLVADNPHLTDELNDDTEARLSGRHFLGNTPPTAKGDKKKLLTRRCRVCHKKGIRREVTTICNQCPSQPALCPVNCFELYHTKLCYWE